MKIKQFKFSADNFGYLVWAKKKAIAIDGGAPEQMISFAGKHNLDIAYVSNTHSHHDHTPGNRVLLDQTGADFIDCRNIVSDQKIHLEQVGAQKENMIGRQNTAQDPRYRAEVDQHGIDIPMGV